MKTKWIGALMGFISGGSILGALAGFVFGSLFDTLTGSGQNSKLFDDNTQQPNSPRNNFLFSLMVLSAHIIQADGRIMHSEMELVRKFLRQNFGDAAVSEGEQILRHLFDYRKQKGESVWHQQIMQACSEMSLGMQEEHRLQLLSFLCEVAKADGSLADVEIGALKEIAIALSLNAGVIDQMLSIGGETLDDAYKVLGITPDATDDEVRKAYRNMALKYHPDRVATLGDDVKEAAKRKFQQINEAKERIYKQRGL